MAVISKALALAALCMVALSSARPHGPQGGPHGHPHGGPHGGGIQHVLLMSIDGFHEKDLANWVASHPHSNLAKLSGNAITYTKAHTSSPSDSFPGMVAQVTGASPITTGVWYDVSYDRTFYAPGSGCKGQQGTVVTYDESIDIDLTKINGGGGIDTTKLPLRKDASGCNPVWPHQFLRVNTIFEVAKKAGFGTAWSDKHLAYDILNGPSGKGIDDLYKSEVASIVAATNVTQISAYDDLHRDAIIRWATGFNSAGQKWHPPGIFGADFQAISVAQKAPDSENGGYANAAGLPNPPLAGAIAHMDDSIGKIIAALKKGGIYEKTLVIISAKHGQSPIDHSLINRIDPNALNTAMGSAVVGGMSADDGALIWLQSGDPYKAASGLIADPTTTGAQIVWAGEGVKLAGFGDPATDPRVPDIIIQSTPGTIYTTGKKIAEHGGFNEDDVHVALMVHNPRIKKTTIDQQVSTRQIAPTILLALGLDPLALEGVQAEGTLPLPLFF